MTMPRYLLIALILTYFIATAWYTNQRHLAFETGAFDTGVYIQPLWNFLQGRGFAVSIIEDNGPLRWATHVEPILFLIAPLYGLWPDPRLLFWLQGAALSLAALPMYALALRRGLSEWTALTVVLAYFLMPATESVTLFDFHAVTFAPLFLLTAFYTLDRHLALQESSLWLTPTSQPAPSPQPSPRGRGGFLDSLSPWERVGVRAWAGVRVNRWSLLTLIAFILALSTKEDISLHVFMIGLYLLFLRRRWLEGGLCVVLGLAWFYLAFQVIIPAYRVGGGHSVYAAWFETLGNTPLEIALSPITKPDKVMALLFRPSNIEALLIITVPLALLPFAGLPMWLMSAPSVAFSLLSNNPTLRQLETWHYAAPMLPFLMLATIDGLGRIRNYELKIKNYKHHPSHLSPLTSHLSLLTSYLSPLTSIFLLLISLTYHHYRGYSPMSLLYEPLDVTTHHELGRQIAQTIPPDTPVLAQAQLIPYVAHREKLGIWNGPLLTDYDYIWFDVSHARFPNRFNAQGDLLTGLAIEPTFGVMAAHDGYLLLKQGAPRDPLPESFFTFTQYDELPASAHPMNAQFGDSLKLVAVKPEIHRLATSETEPQIVLYFEVLKTPAEDDHLFLYRLNEHGEVKGATDYPQPALFWWPTSRWQAGDKRQVRVNTIPWWTGDQTIFGYAVGLSRADDAWAVGARLPVTSPESTPLITQLQPDHLYPVAAFERWAGLAYPAPLSIIELK